MTKLLVQLQVSKTLLSPATLIVQELFHNLNFVCLNFLTLRILTNQEKSRSFVLKYLLLKSEWLIA